MTEAEPTAGDWTPGRNAVMATMEGRAVAIANLPSIFYPLGVKVAVRVPYRQVSANARLMAASKRLLAALEKLLPHIDRGSMGGLAAAEEADALVAELRGVPRG